MRIHSQNGEDGIIRKIFKMIGDYKHGNTFVEIGAGDGRECNTRALREFTNWKGVALDSHHENKDIGLYREFVTVENIGRILKKYTVSLEVDLLSVDIDFNDYYVLEQILKLGYRPKVIVCEYNASHPPTENKVVKYDMLGKWDGSDYFGVSLLALSNMCRQAGYTLVCCDLKGVNAFFVRSDFADVIATINNAGNVEALYRPPKYGREAGGGGHPRDAQNREFLSIDN
jgi:hypothetical protein